MPDISLLDPRVLNGVIQRMPPADGLMGKTLVRNRSYPLPVWEYDVQTRRRNVARPNTPDSPAIVIDQGGLGRMVGGFIYTREKKVFSPTVIRWLRAPGQLAGNNAEAEVTREMQELSARADRFEEYLTWSMLSKGSFDLSNLGHAVSIDYQIPSTHIFAVTNAWNAAGSNPQKDMEDVRRLMTRASDAVLTNVYGNIRTISAFYQNDVIRSWFSETQKNQMVTEGTLPRFNGVNFAEYDRGYVDDFTTPATPTFRPYLPDGTLVGVAQGGPDTFAYLQGPSADDDAPQGNTGRFSKTWKEPDPSSRQVLLETNGFPVLYQPQHLIIFNVFGTDPKTATGT